MVAMYENEARQMLLAISQPILTVTDRFSSEVIRIDPEGKLFWRGREVQTDADFRASMLEMRDTVMTWGGGSSGPTIFGFNIN